MSLDGTGTYIPIEHIHTAADMKAAVILAGAAATGATEALCELLGMEYTDWRWPSFVWSHGGHQRQVKIKADAEGIFAKISEIDKKPICLRWDHEKCVWRYQGQLVLWGEEGRARLTYALWLAR